jgi:protein-L-isoaspartate(D-aspartate) O-methyltransferase
MTLTRRLADRNGLRSTNGSTPMLAAWERAVKANLALFGAIGVVAVGSSACDNRVHMKSFAQQRADMVAHIEESSRLPGSGFGTAGVSANILEAMRETKRHLFVPEKDRRLAYADRPVSIGQGQTISQPYIVALMTHLAGVEPGYTVLEVGTGSGYQAAILSRLVRKVCTIEIVKDLGEQASRRLQELGYQNVDVRIGDGYAGWPECSPFDAIIVTAALDHVPRPLIDQLKASGRLVMPVGPSGRVQNLMVVEKLSSGQTKTHSVAPVRFVPFTRNK